MFKTAIVSVLLLSTAQAGEMYVQGGIGLQAQHGGCYANGQRMPVCLWDRTQVQPVVGSVELGYAHAAGRFTFSLFARHDSQPAVNDYGINQIGAAIRLRLWSSK